MGQLSDEDRKALGAFAGQKAAHHGEQAQAREVEFTRFMTRFSRALGDEMKRVGAKTVTDLGKEKIAEIHRNVKAEGGED